MLEMSEVLLGQEEDLQAFLFSASVLLFLVQMLQYLPNVWTILKPLFLFTRSFKTIKMKGEGNFD